MRKKTTQKKSIESEYTLQRQEEERNAEPKNI